MISFFLYRHNGRTANAEKTKFAGPEAQTGPPGRHHGRQLAATRYPPAASGLTTVTLPSRWET